MPGEFPFLAPLRSDFICTCLGSKTKNVSEPEKRTRRISVIIVLNYIFSLAAEEGRPRRSTRGQGGVVAQLAAIGTKITEKTTRRSRPATTVPDATVANVMAPPAAKKRRAQVMASINLHLIFI